MNTEKTVKNETKGWLFYDADCAPCVRAASLTSRGLARRGFELSPLQTPGTPQRVGVSPEALRHRIHLLTCDGRRFAGADALIEIGRHLLWARPLVLATRVPGVTSLLRRAYDAVAARRYCPGGACRVPRNLPVLDGLPLLLLPAAAFALRGRVADWVFMWILALALFAGCKWLAYRKALATGTRLGLFRSIGYFLAWVGMEPEPFASRNRPQVPERKEWFRGLGRVVAGLVLLWGAARWMPSSVPLLAGWTGMLGIILLLHFGLFQLLALAWQRAGVPVKPLMRAPLGATSLGDLWGARWNTGFHAVAHRFLFRPIHRRIGRIAATLAVFLVSGLVHELVITVPARGGYGLPTAYFLLQGAGLLLERSGWGRRLGLGAGIPGRAFTLILAALPAFGLFPPVFVRHVILPMLHAIGAT